MVVKNNFFWKVLFLCSPVHGLGAEGGDDKYGGRESPMHALVRLADSTGVIGKDGTFDRPAAELVIKVAVVVGLMQGVIKFFGDVIGNSVRAIVRKMPYFWHVASRLFLTGFDKVCGCVDPYEPQHIALLGSLFDNVMRTLCSDTLPENFSYKGDFTENQVGKTAIDFNWNFYRHFTDNVFSYIIKELEAGHHYYVSAQERSNKKGFLDKMVGNFMLRDRAAIIFVSAMLIENVRHISSVCNEALDYEHLDNPHLKKMFKSTNHLFQKLHGLLQGPKVLQDTKDEFFEVLFTGSLEILKD